jgi:plastocyanin
MHSVKSSLALAVFAVITLATACGGSDSPTSPSGGGGGISEATITITPTGTTPKAVTISSGNRVTFVNNDTRPRRMSSDPHPVHTDCPGLTVDLLQPGQSRESSNLTARRTCGFHDHDDPDNSAVRGTVTVQ